MVKLTFRGLCAAAFTAFRNDMSLNLEIIPSYAKYLFDSGINAVLVNGSTGEGMSLSISERKAVAEEWVKAVKPTKQHVMIQVGGCLFPHVLELAKHAETIGADSILCLPELYYSPKTSKQLIRYLKHVGDAAPRTPLLYYHNPKMTGVDLNMRQFMDEAAKELPTFQGIKFTSIDLDGAASALKANNGQYAVFLGTNTLFAGAAIMGIDSIMGSILNVKADLAINIMKAVKEGRTEEAIHLQNELSAAVAIIGKFGDKEPTTKTAMNLISPIDVGKVRLPMEHLTEEQQNGMKSALKSLSLI